MERRKGEVSEESEHLKLYRPLEEGVSQARRLRLSDEVAPADEDPEEDEA